MNTISINRWLSCSPLKNRTSKKIFSEEKHRSKNLLTIHLHFFQGVQQRSTQMYCLVPKINTFDRLEWSVESEVFDEESVKKQWFSVSVLRQTELHQAWNPPDTTRLADSRCCVIYTFLSPFHTHPSTCHSQHAETTLWTDWFPQITWPPPTFGSLYFYLAL